MSTLRGMLLLLVMLAASACPMTISTSLAAAQANCNVPDPPPICDGPNPSEPAPPQVIGSFDGAAVQPQQGGIEFSGWAIDRRTTAPIYVQISVQTVIAGKSMWVRTEVLANQNRPDVGAAYPTYGSLHGFFSWWALDGATTGTHLACVAGKDTVTGAYVTLGCRYFTGA